MTPLDARSSRSLSGGPSFPLANRAERAVWTLAWLLLARWTPPQARGWRRLLLRIFGAQVGAGADVRASARVWLPRNLTLGRGATLGPGVDCYNQAPITLGDGAIVSQRAFLCAGAHDVDDSAFQLVVQPIEIGAGAWIAAEAFVGPGARVGERAVLGARGVAFGLLEPDTIYAGNPARALRKRRGVAGFDPIAAPR